MTFRTTPLAPRVISASFLSTLTQASVEIEGRPYGGGVIKLELGDARRLTMVVPAGKQAETLAAAYPRIDLLLRTGRVEEAVDLVDQIVLAGELGLRPKDILALQMGVMRLRTRRIGRKARVGQQDVDELPMARCE